MQDKAIGIVVFLLVGTVMTGLAAGEADWGAIALGSLSTAGTWATAITALAVAGMAMGTYNNGTAQCRAEHLSGGGQGDRR